jgi:hypothetical protein
MPKKENMCYLVVPAPTENDKKALFYNVKGLTMPQIVGPLAE